MKAFKVQRNQDEYLRLNFPQRLFDARCCSVIAKTRRKTLDKAQALIDKCIRGVNTNGAEATVAAVLARVLDYYRTDGGVALGTWQDYRYYVERNIVPTIGKLPLGELKPLQVDECFALYAGTGSATTAEYAHSHLTARFSSRSSRTSSKSIPVPLAAVPLSASAVSNSATLQLLEATKGYRHEGLYALAITLAESKDAVQKGHDFATPAPPQ